MRRDPALLRTARRLLALSLQDGQVSQERVSAILASLRTHAPRNHKALLEQYLLLLRQEVARSQALLEYAGKLTETTLADLRRTLSTHYGRPIDLLPQETPSLLAGFRIRVADDIWDASALGRLRQIQANN